MTPWPAWLRLGLLLPVLGLNAFVLKRLLVQFAPFPGLFLTAALIAFLLDLPCRWLAQRGLPRAWAIVSVVLVTLGLLVWAAVALVPLLIEQLSQLLTASPSLLTAAEQWIDRGQLWALDRGLPADFADLSSDLVAQFSRLATQLSQRLLGLLGATVGTTINVVIVLVLAVFLLFGADPIVEGLARWLPDRWRDLVQTTLEHTFRGYFARPGGVGADPQWWSASGVHRPEHSLRRLVRCADRLHHPGALCQCRVDRLGECGAGGSGPPHRP